MTSARFMPGMLLYTGLLLLLPLGLFLCVSFVVLCFSCERGVGWLLWLLVAVYLWYRGLGQGRMERRPCCQRL